VAFGLSLQTIVFTTGLLIFPQYVILTYHTYA
jgi:hypothetical protein